MTIVFVCAFVLGCGLALFRHPIYGLVTYVGVFYLNPPMHWWGQAVAGMRWSLLAGAVTLVAVLVRPPKRVGTPFYRQPVVWGFVLFILWIALQSFWALDPEMHADLLSMYIKFLVVIFFMYRSIDSEEHLRLFLWAHVLGCLYLGWVATTSYTEGRFEAFDAPGIGEANAGALQLVTGVLIGGSLFLAGRLRSKGALLGALPVIVNGVVTTISRSAFLAIGVGGLIFNLFTPTRYRRWVRMLSALAVVLFLLVTNQVYWARMSSLEHAGEDVQGVDTGAGRLVLIEAQLRMFRSYPLGCGHRCTAVLSPTYLDDRFLADAGPNRTRSSHNTFMSLLVEQGLPGAVFYALYVGWVLVSLARVARRLQKEQGFLAILLPAVASCAVAIMIGDVFVDYMKFEMRIWTIVMVMAMVKLTDPVPQAAPRPQVGRAFATRTA
jgi:O-Antigen ligase